MVDSGQLLGFTVASLVLIVVPEPGVLFVVARSPRRLSFVGGAGGLAMITVGITIAVTGRKD